MIFGYVFTYATSMTADAMSMTAYTCYINDCQVVYGCTYLKGQRFIWSYEVS